MKMHIASVGLGWGLRFKPISRGCLVALFVDITQEIQLKFVVT